MACANEDDVPPLEDMSELLNQITILHSVKEDREESPKNNEQASLTENDENCKPQKQTIKKNKQTFGGFQKGFLNKKAKGTDSEQTRPNDEQMVTIHPKQEHENNLRFPEVQKAMETPLLLQNNDWVTDDLLKKLKDRPDLLQKLSDPQYSQALSLIQSNAEQGWKLLQGNTDLQTFIKEFCSVLGDHFTSMAEQTTGIKNNNTAIDGKTAAPQTTASKEDNEKMSEILSDPATLDVLKDPWISKLIKNLKDNPIEARRMLATSKPEVLPKIKKLIDAGILSYG